jgi:DNA-binding MarR family transcriptional regulator
MFLSVHDNVNQDEIAKNFAIDKGAITKTIQKLEEKNLVIRIENYENKREKLVSLTKSAQEILEQMSSILSEWNTYVYDGINEIDRQKFEAIAEIIAKNAIKLTKGKKEQHI